MLPKIKRSVLLVSLLSLPLLALAADTRSPLGGTYSIKQASAEGKTITVTMSFRLINVSDTDLRNATLTVADHQPAMLPLEPKEEHTALPRYNNHGSVNLPVIASRSHEVVIKDAMFTVPAIEFEQWKKGERPVFMVSYQLGGKHVEAPARLVRRDEPGDSMGKDGGAR
jgi:hypothetical protein